MQQLTSSNGYIVYGDERQVWFTTSRTQWIFTIQYMVGLTVIILCINSIIQWWLSPQLGSVLLAVTLVLLGGLMVIGNYKKTALAREPHQQTLLLMVDRTTGQVFDGQQRLLTTVDQLSVHRVWQLTSSSRALAVKWPGGQQIIARGNPFGGSVDSIEKVITTTIATGTS